MENLAARNQQLKNEASKLCTTLGQEITNETRATWLAKLYTALLDEQLSADPQASLALSMILNLKSSIGFTTELTNLMNSALSDSLDTWSPSNFANPYTRPNYIDNQGHLNMGPVFTSVFDKAKTKHERETIRLYGGRKFPKTLEDFLNTVSKRCFEPSSNEGVLNQQCDKLQEWNEAGNRWMEIIRHGDDQLIKIVEEKIPRMTLVDTSLGKLLDQCLIHNRDVLEMDIENIRFACKTASFFLSSPTHNSSPMSPEQLHLFIEFLHTALESTTRAVTTVSMDKDIIYHMQELANQLGQDGVAGFLRLGLVDL